MPAKTTEETAQVEPELTLESELGKVYAALAEVDISSLDRTPYLRDQKPSATAPRQNPAPRKFSWTGPSADTVVKLVLVGGWTRAEMAKLAGCSVSRVAEVVWGLDAKGVKYPEIVKNRKAATPVAV